MKTFVERVKNLLAISENSNVKNTCNKVLELRNYTNESGLRDMLVDELKKLTLSEAEKKFIAIEKKLSILDTMGLNEAFIAIDSSNILKEAPRAKYLINNLRESFYTKSADSIYIAETLLNALAPFAYNPIIESVLSKIAGIFESYQEDILLFKTIKNLTSGKHGQMYNQLAESIYNYIIEGNYKNRRQLIAEMQKYSFEGTVRESLKHLVKYQNDSSLYVVNENNNFKVQPIHSFVYFDPSNPNNYYFYTLGSVYEYNSSNELRQLSENEIKDLPTTFKNINAYINRPNVSLNNNSLKINLQNGNIEFIVNEDKENEAYFNGIKITGSPYKYLLESGLFGMGSQEDLTIINKIWENLNLLTEIDFGKNIISNIQNGVSSTIFKLGEEFSVHTRNVLERKFNFANELNGLQARNYILEFMKYDIRESLYEYLDGPESNIAKIKNDQRIIENDIQNIKNQILKIDNAMGDVLVGKNSELMEIKEALTDEIEFLRGKYNELNESINNLEHVVTEDVEEFRTGATVRIKNSGVVGDIVAINTVTGVVSVLTDEGDTIETTISEIEIIDGSVAKDLDDIKAKGSLADGTVKETSEGEQLFGYLRKRI